MKVFEDRKEQLLNTLLKWIVALGALAYVPSLIACIHDGLYVLAAIDTAAYIVIAAVFFCPRSTYQSRLFTTVAATLIVGAAVLYQTGSEGAGHIWLLCAVFISALFGRVRVIVVTVALSQAALISYAVFSLTGLIQSSVSLVSLAAISSNMLLISITLSLITFHLLNALKVEIDAQDEVLELLDHRVKNNLQVIESLVSMERPDGDEEDTLSRRIRAVSAANDLLLHDTSHPWIDLDELIRVISDPESVSIDGKERIRISPEKMTEVAVGLSDLLYILRDAAPLAITVDEKISIRGAGSFPTADGLRSRMESVLMPPDWIEIPKKSGAGGAHVQVIEVHL